jgi:hypothetical protein
MKIAVPVRCISAFGTNLAVADDIADIKKLENDLWEVLAQLGREQVDRVDGA